jgi:glutamate N-acetyltransferase/amino-acid N-acetyltransferase
MRAQSRATAVLGPTNTGKTHYAIERMLAHRTGVIGLPLPMARIEPNYQKLVEGLAPKKGREVARSIITSDTHEKEFAISLELHGKRIRIGGCAKGAGMINPNMATMLCLITTDASVGRNCLNEATRDAVNHTFNRITIDGDTSTNDTVLVLANGAAENKTIRRGTKECGHFAHALRFVMNRLAKAIVRDGGVKAHMARHSSMSGFTK